MPDPHDFDTGILTAEVRGLREDLLTLRATVELLAKTTNRIEKCQHEQSVAARTLKNVGLFLFGVWIVVKTGDVSVLRSLFTGS